MDSAIELTIPFNDVAYVYLVPSKGFSQVGIYHAVREEWLKVDAQALIRVPNLNGNPNAALDQINQARALGYAHVEQMVCEHDLLHMWLAYDRGLPYSPVLFNIAAGLHSDPVQQAQEEADVMGLTHYVNTGTWNEHWGQGCIPPEQRVQYRERVLDFLVGTRLRVWQ